MEQSSREELLEKALDTHWDVIVVGGGITGAGILREAVRRGLKALVLEKKDFAWGTSSRSSKMVHGGLRYLKEGNIALTRESVHERENLVAELPGLVTLKRFVIPKYRNKLLSGLMMHAGLIIYDLLSGKWRKHLFSVSEMKKQAPHVAKKGLRGGYIMNDAVTDDARLVYRVLTEARAEGGMALNYCRVDSLLKDGQRVSGLMFVDEVNGNEYSLKTKLVINATGAWADQLRNQVIKINKQKIRPLRGSHLIFSADRLPLVDNISFMHPEDGRPVMALTWEGRVIMGTTDKDHPHEMDEEASISSEEVRYLLAGINYQFPDLNLTAADIISTQAGIRPVIDTGKADPSAESRDHLVWNEDGLLTVTGGKLTTFRIIALDTLKAAQAVLGPLPEIKKKRKIFIHTEKLPSDGVTGVEAETESRLWGRYGYLAPVLVQQAEAGELEKVNDTYTLWAELRWAAKREMVVHLDDLLLRRTRIGLLIGEGGKSFLPQIKKICQSVLDWDDRKWNDEETRYLKIWKQHYSIPQ